MGISVRTELVDRLGEIEAALGAFEFGDVLALSSIAGKIDGLLEFISRTSGLSKLGPYLAHLAPAASLLSYPATEERAKGILQDSVSDVSAFLLKKLPGEELARSVRSRAAAVRGISEPQAPAGAAVPEPGATESAAAERPSYPAGYFDNLIGDEKMLSQFYSEAKDRIAEAQSVLVELEDDARNPDHLNTVFRAFHTIKGSSAFLGLKNIEELGHAIEDLLALLRDGKLVLDRDLIDVVLRGAELLELLLETMVQSGFKAEELKRTFAEIDIFPYRDAVAAVAGHGNGPGSGSADRALAAAARQISVQRGVGEKAARLKKSSVVKVSNERLGMLVDMVGELVINLSMLKQELRARRSGDGEAASVNQLEAITTTIKNQVLSMGMVPIADIFGKLRVVARNTAGELGKTVHFESEGEETELDRNVIETIYDPLMHIVRNAVDHGIESAEERSAAGKEAAGRIRISAAHKGSGIEIAIADDGRGIDTDRVKAKARERGLADSEALDAMGAKEIYGFMFQPGFSTAEKVTAISGRGVGLDVVKKNIDALHGRIDVVSEPGSFTRFLIRLPLTLAIIDGFVARIGENKYVFPFSAIEEILVLDPEAIGDADGEADSVIFHRDGYVPVVRPHRVFREQPDPHRDGRALALLFSTENSKYCVVVDELLGKQEIVVKNLSEFIVGECRALSGGTIFGDGSIGFVVDMEGFFEAVK